MVGYGRRSAGLGTGRRWAPLALPHRILVMCRNITTLRGLVPPATPREIEAAARQYVRKVSGVQKTSAATETAFEEAVARVSAATAQVLTALPPRRVPPRNDPPIRRLLGNVT